MIVLDKSIPSGGSDTVRPHRGEASRRGARARSLARVVVVDGLPTRVSGASQASASGLRTPRALQKYIMMQRVSSNSVALFQEHHLRQIHPLLNWSELPLRSWLPRYRTSA